MAGTGSKGHEGDEERQHHEGHESADEGTHEGQDDGDEEGGHEAAREETGVAQAGGGLEEASQAVPECCVPLCLGGGVQKDQGLEEAQGCLREVWQVEGVGGVLPPCESSSRLGAVGVQPGSVRLQTLPEAEGALPVVWTVRRSEEKVKRVPWVPTLRDGLPLGRRKWHELAESDDDQDKSEQVEGPLPLIPEFPLKFDIAVDDEDFIEDGFGEFARRGQLKAQTTLKCFDVLLESNEQEVKMAEESWSSAQGLELDKAWLDLALEQELAADEEFLISVCQEFELIQIAQKEGFLAEQADKQRLEFYCDEYQELVMEIRGLGVPGILTSSEEFFEKVRQMLDEGGRDSLVTVKRVLANLREEFFEKVRQMLEQGSSDSLLAKTVLAKLKGFGTSERELKPD